MYEFMPYILQISKSSLFICASLNQTAKLGLLTIEVGRDSCPETSVTTDLWSITSQKSKHFIFTLAVAQYHAWYY